MATNDAMFTGSVPELYTRHMGAVFFEPYAVDLAHRCGLTAGALLETACGTGILTRALAAALPAAVTITATDLNQPMLDYAQRQAGGERVSWQQANAQHLPFADRSFDAVVCQFGVMFFPDRVGAYREVYRVLKPGGHFLFSVWDRIETTELFALVQTTVAEMFPVDPPLFLARTPCGYHDISRVRGDLGQAGFADCTVDVLKLPARAAAAIDPAVGLIRGTPVCAEIMERDPAGPERAVAAATAAITARFGAGSFESTMQAIVFAVRRGGLTGRYSRGSGSGQKPCASTPSDGLNLLRKFSSAIAAVNSTSCASL
jgi:SAM-dependent methyltransferase